MLPSRATRGVLTIAALAAALVAAIGLGGAVTVTTPSGSAASAVIPPTKIRVDPASPGSAQVALAALALAPDAALVSCKVGTTTPSGCYSRAAFLPHGWADGSGCDSRRDALARQAVADVVNRSGCILTATVFDPYSGTRIASTKADADHVVPLGYAWAHGAASWDAATRVRFGHEPMNLIAVSASLNRSKGDSLTWEPPAASFRCAYVARQISIIAVYRLTLSPAAHAAMAATLATCPAQTIPTTPERDAP